MSRAFFFLLSLLSFTDVIAQKDANIWYFGFGVGLDFNNQQLVSLSGSQMRQFEGCASIADPLTGKLLFYSDGKKVWNRAHQVMPHGSGLTGSFTSTQSALFVPAPESENLYYLFTIKAANDTTPSGLHYSMVDRRLNNGLGDVVASTKNTILLTASTEKLTAVPSLDGKQYWIISHEYDSDQFVVWSLSVQGISDPRFIQIGSRHEAREVRVSGSIGYLKASPDGTKLACAVYGYAPSSVELYDFDPSSGEITNYRPLGEFQWAYGISFSPDNSKLYFSTASGISQMDVSQPDLETILASRTHIEYVTQPYQVGKDIVYDTLSTNGALQLGPDGKLYTSTYYIKDPYRKEYGLLIIDYPDLAGAACHPSLTPVEFTKGTPSLGLPNLIQSSFNYIPSVNFSVIPEETCLDTPFINISPNPSNDKVSVRINDNCIVPLTIETYNVVGQRVTEIPLQGRNQTEVDVSRWSAGLYLLKLQYQNMKDGKSTSTVVKVIVVH